MVTDASLVAAKASARLLQLQKHFWLSESVRVDGGVLVFVRSLAGIGRATPAAGSWAHEAVAMAIGKAVVVHALAKYPTTVAQDADLLIQTKDSRLRMAVTLRQDEKVVLQWWMKLFEAAEQHAQPLPCAYSPCNTYRCLASPMLGFVAGIVGANYAPYVLWSEQTQKTYPEVHRFILLTVFITALNLPPKPRM